MSGLTSEDRLAIKLALDAKQRETIVPVVRNITPIEDRPPGFGRTRRHGTRNEYEVHGCRCDPCKRAKYEHGLIGAKPCKNNCGRVVRTTNQSGLCRKCFEESRFKHGTEYRYAQGCRCELCTKEASRVRKVRRDRAKARKRDVVS